MKKYVCPCGYVYDPALGDPDNGVAPGTPWEEVPEDLVCPTCGLGKYSFDEEDLPLTYKTGASCGTSRFLCQWRSAHHRKRVLVTK